MCIFETFPNRAPKTLHHLKSFWSRQVAVSEMKLSLSYKNYLPIPMVFCVNVNTMPEMIIRKQLFPSRVAHHLVFHRSTKTGKTMVQKLFNTLERELSNISNFKKFQEKCRENVELGMNGGKQHASIPNMHRFFKWYWKLPKNEKKSVREEIYGETQGDLNLILNEIYQRGIRIEARIDE